MLRSARNGRVCRERAAGRAVAMGIRKSNPPHGRFPPFPPFFPRFGPPFEFSIDSSRLLISPSSAREGMLRNTLNAPALSFRGPFPSAGWRILLPLPVRIQAGLMPNSNSNVRSQTAGMVRRLFATATDDCFISRRTANCVCVSVPVADIIRSSCSKKG